jgi:hypothetical protein
MRGGLNLGMEHGGDIARDSTVGAVVDPEADTLPSPTPWDSLSSTTSRELASGRHAALGPEGESPSRVLWSTSVWESSSACHVLSAGATTGSTMDPGSVAIPVPTESTSVLDGPDNVVDSSNVIPAQHGTHLQHGICKPKV